MCTPVLDRVGQGEHHAQDRLKRLEKEMDVAKQRDVDRKKQAAEKAHESEVHIKGLTKIFNRGREEDEEQIEDEEDEDEEHQQGRIIYFTK